MPMMAARVLTGGGGGAPFIDLDIDSRALQFELLDGTVVMPFNSPDQFVMPGFTGFGLAPRNVVTDTTPGLDGGWLREVQIMERRIFLPFFISSDTGHDAYLDVLAQLRRAVSIVGMNQSTLTANNGHFNLVAQSSLGERVLTVAYVDGLEGDESVGVAGSSWATYGVNLVAVDPYWRERGTITQSYQVQGSGVFLGTGSNAAPWPRRLSATTIVGSSMVINVDSDVPISPELRVTGPATAMTYTANSGASITYTGTIPSGQQLVITTGRVKTATLNGVSVWGNLAQGSSMPPLLPGNNVVSVTLSGATTASLLQVVYRKGWESAW